MTHKQVISTFKFAYPHLTLKEGPKVKSDPKKRFQVHDFLHLGLPSQTSRTNNKWVISTSKFAYPHLTLKERPKVKYDHTKILPAHDFLHVALLSHTSRTNNKRVISTFNFDYPRLTLKGAPRSNPTTAKDSLPMISYMLVYHPKVLGPIISEL